MDVISSYKKSEYTVTIEDITVRMLVNYLNQGENHTTTLLTLHSHLYAEIFVCLQGELHIQTEDSVIRLFKGDTAIIPANISHKKIDSSDVENWCAVGFFVVKKSGKSFSNLYKNLRPLYEGENPIVFRNVPKLCERIFELHNPLYEKSSYLPALELVSILSNFTILKPHKNYSDIEPKTRMPDIYRMAWFEDLIANRYYEPLTTSKVADMLHISSRHLSRIIKARYGKTFHEVLIKVRLENAAKLLTSTDSSVNNIIKKVGYNKSSLFYKDFKEHFNISPLEYRKNHSDN